MKTALVIGGTGPTGPHVISGFMARDFNVTLLHRGVHEPPGLPDVRHIHADPHFRDPIDEALGTQTFDVVACMYGRVAMLAEALANRCGQFIAVGGVPAYRNVLEPWRHRPHGPALPAREDDPLADVNGAAPKFAARILNAERAVFRVAENGGYRGTVVRYPAIHGPRNQNPHEWMVLRRLRDKRPFIILPDGGLGIMARCAAPNAAEVILRCVDNPEVANGEAFNAADDTQYSWRQWVDVVVDAAERGDLMVQSLPFELAVAAQSSLIAMRDYAHQTLFDMSKARTLLGYREIVTAQQQIQYTVRELLQNPPDVHRGVGFVDPFDYVTEDALVVSYRRAIEQVKTDVTVEPPELFHPLPHPKVPTLSVDQRGR